MTFEPGAPLQPLGVNAVAVDGSSVWTVRGQPFDVAQRFDVASG